MIVYTSNAATALGSDNAAKSKAGTWVANLNTCLKNSSLGSITATLVHTEKISQNFGQDGHSKALQHLGNDGTIKSLRNKHKADLVSIIIEGKKVPSGKLGLGSLLMSSGGNASHNKTAIWHSAPSDTFAHEIGHNHGCGHEVGNGGSLLKYSRGNHFKASGKGYRTIMAYQKTGYYTGSSRFSSPSVQYKGAATGNGNADNVKTISKTNPAIQKYK